MSPGRIFGRSWLIHMLGLWTPLDSGTYFFGIGNTKLGLGIWPLTKGVQKLVGFKCCIYRLSYLINSSRSKSRDWSSFWFRWVQINNQLHPWMHGWSNFKAGFLHNKTKALDDKWWPMTILRLSLNKHLPTELTMVHCRLGFSQMVVKYWWFSPMAPGRVNKKVGENWKSSEI